MDQKSLITLLTERICVPQFCVGSPTYAALKYEVPECDLTILRRKVNVPMGQKIDKFGLKLKHGCVWLEWEIFHTDCVAQRNRLDSFGVQHGRHVREYYVDQGSYGDRVIPEHVEWAGDISQLEYVNTYLNLVAQ